jgi:branched-subunit amino acid ABC-type transport system permease component
VVIVIGGLGSLRGAVIAGLLIDAVQTLAEFFNTDADHPHWVCHRSWSRPLRMWF